MYVYVGHVVGVKVMVGTWVEVRVDVRAGAILVGAGVSYQTPTSPWNDETNTTSARNNNE